MKKLLLFVLTALVFTLNAQAQDCPRIFTKGDTLYTDPAPQYQWFRDNNPINGATKQWYLPVKGGNFSVQVSGTTAEFSYTPPTVEKTITGRIVDERYEPIADAMVAVGVKNVKSDGQGRFILDGVPVSHEKTVVTITKDDFWKNSQRLHFFEQDTAALTAMLEPLKVTNRFDAQKGATISERGFFLTFPPNSAVTESGQVYTGTINISLKRSFPSEDGFGLRMPGGDFSAIDQNGQEKMLVSYGFMSAEMNGSNGEKLKLASDKDATLEFYIPWEQNKTAPDSMPLWHFDESAGTWRPEGIARKVGPRYVGTVKHFSSWNCDVPQNRATVKGKARSCKGTPISNMTVKIGQRLATTDIDGYYSTFVPSDTRFNITSKIDTVLITSLTEGEYHEVRDLVSNEIVEAVGIIDSTETLNVYGSGVIEYSLDGGITFYPKTQKIKFPGIKPKSGIARDSFNCKMNFSIFLLPKSNDCKLLDSSALAQEYYYAREYDALTAEGTVYQLELSNGSLRDIDIIGRSFPCLHHLILQNNGIDYLPDNFWQLSNLQFLDLSNNRLTNVSESIAQLNNLQILVLSDNRLNTLPESFGELHNLQDLSIYNNSSMTILPESLTRLINLEYLTISGNNLTALPESFGQLFSLRNVHASDNKLTALPESFGQLTKLQTITLRNNQLNSIPESIGQLSNLKYVNLIENQLTTLPESIANLKDNLKELWLLGNPISEEEKAKIRAWLPNTTITF